MKDENELLELLPVPKAIFLTIWRKIIILIPLIFILPHFVSDAAMIHTINSVPGKEIQIPFILKI